MVSTSIIDSLAPLPPEHLGGYLGASWGLLSGVLGRGILGNSFKCPQGVLGHLGGSCGISWGILQPSFRYPGEVLGHPRGILGRLESIQGHLEASLGV